MKADPADQLRLLDVQVVDTTLDQLAHRRRTLPELAELTRLDAEIEVAAAARDQARKVLDALDARIAAVEKEVASVRQRADRDRTRMDSGAVPAKELESLQHEIETLSARQTELEDGELDLMETREGADAEHTAAAGRLDALLADKATAESTRDAGIAEIDGESARRRSEREELAAALPAPLRDLYEKLRANNGGVGAAMLRARRCEGCRLELSGTALSQVRAAAEDEVVRCDECGRILVRTKESGL